MIVEDYPYDNTICESRQRSFEKALAIFKEQQQSYERKRLEKIKRPNISVKKGLFRFVVSLLILFFLLPYLLSVFIDSFGTRILITLIASGMVFLIFMQKIIVWLIQVYQKIAPDKLRLACVFEPSCSEYMLMAIEKYGSVKGVSKGIRRLLRCHYPNGGADNP